MKRFEALVTRATAHAESARSMWNKHHKAWSTEDQTEVLALVSIAESLAVIAAFIGPDTPERL